VTLLCLAQERVEQEEVEGEWEQIQNTILEVTTDSNQFRENAAEQMDPEQSLIELVERRWIQRIATKMQNCSVEEHPEALSVSAFSATMNAKKFSC
jgi:hypothetical protein